MKQIFFWNSLAFSMIQQILAIRSLVPLPFLNPAWTSGSSWFTYWWSLAWRILSITLLVCEMSATVRESEYSLALPFFGASLGAQLVKNPPATRETWVWSHRAGESWELENRGDPVVTGTLLWKLPPLKWQHEHRGYVSNGQDLKRDWHFQSSYKPFCLDESATHLERMVL